MKYKLPSNHKQVKFLKSLLNTKTTYKGGFLADNDFYSRFNFSKDEIIQMLNALDNKNLIEMYPPSADRPFTWIKVSQYAFAYLPEVRHERFRFWAPIVISAIALIKSFFPQLVLLWKLIAQLWK